MLAAGLVLALAAAGLQFFSPASGEILAGRDVKMVLTGDTSSIVLVYHPFSGAVNSFSVSHRRFRSKTAAEEKARQLAEAVSGGNGPVFFLAVSSVPSLAPLLDAMSGWREDPRLLFRAASWAAGLRSSGATNLTGFDIFTLFSELAARSSSDFILTELTRKAALREDADADGERRGAPLVEVFNASGVNGLAGRTAKRLREMGFDVITVSSKPRSARTKLVSFSKDTAVARSLQEALGLGELETLVAAQQKSVAAAAVILGEDFAGVKEK